MSDNHSEEQHIGIPGYLGVFTILIVGTILTYYVATIDLDWIFAGANTLVALLIAFTKMACVMLFFMHVRWSPRMIWL
ncbi:MAG TPA: cytochrome C oxidase subunit IV family protein, partial [Pyrinomonadaceae bacterium]|nr:cytochrome C oxidase subunit IV family protein [Pyrinomonadaceae bacterium]